MKIILYICDIHIFNTEIIYPEFQFTMLSYREIILIYLLDYLSALKTFTEKCRSFIRRLGNRK